MRRNLVPAMAAIALAGLLAMDCVPTVGAFDNRIGGSQATETAAFAGGTTTLKSAVGAALAVTGYTATLVNAADQRGYVDFNYEIDAATATTAISIFPLSDAADNYTAFTRGTAIPLTFDVKGTRLYFSGSFVGSTAKVEIFLDATKLTARGGTQKLDTNGNGSFGEESDSVSDDGSLVVGTAPGATAPAAVTVGASRSPGATLPGFATTGLLAASAVLDIATYVSPNLLTFTVRDTGSSAVSDKVSITSSVVVYKNVAGVWTVVPSTLFYASAGNIASVTLDTPPKKGESYKVVVDKYNIVESQAVAGYIHRASWLPSDDTLRYVTRYYTFTAAGGAQQNVTVTKGSSVFGNYLDVTINGALSPVDLATITGASLKVRLAAGTVLATGTAPGEFVTPYTLVAGAETTFDTVSNAVYSFRLYLPATIKTLTTGRVEIAPSVMSLAHSTITARDTLSFGNIAGTDGWRIKAF